MNQLARIVHDMEVGNYPVCYKSGIRCIQLPPGVKPRIPSLDNKDSKAPSFEKLFTALAETKRKAAKYEAMMLKKGFGNDSTGVAEKIQSQEHKRFLSNWDAQKFADEFCRIGGSAEVGAGAEKDGGGGKEAEAGAQSSQPGGQTQQKLKLEPVAHEALNLLNSEQLKALCVDLKNRAVGLFDAQAEKVRVKDEVMRELSAHPTIEYLRHLEMEVTRYRELLHEEVEKNKQLRVALSTSMK